MKKWILLCFLPLFGCSRFPQTTEIPAITACELFSNPKKYNGRQVIVTGRIIIAFEHQELLCLDKNPAKQPLAFGPWLRVDLDSIEKKSPKFFARIKKDYELAQAWKSEMRGIMQFRGLYKAAQWIKEGHQEPATPMSGYGHFGMFDGEITIEEVLDYQPQPALN